MFVCVLNNWIDVVDQLLISDERCSNMHHIYP